MNEVLSYTINGEGIIGYNMTKLHDQLKFIHRLLEDAGFSIKVIGDRIIKHPKSASVTIEIADNDKDCFLKNAAERFISILKDAYEKCMRDGGKNAHNKMALLERVCINDTAVVPDAMQQQKKGMNSQAISGNNSKSMDNNGKNDKNKVSKNDYVRVVGLILESGTDKLYKPASELCLGKTLDDLLIEAPVCLPRNHLDKYTNHPAILESNEDIWEDVINALLK